MAAGLLQFAQDGLSFAADPVGALIHPPRNVWTEAELVAEHPWLATAPLQCINFSFVSRGQMLKAMLLYRTENGVADKPMVVHLHGHGSDRWDGLQLAEFVTPFASFASFDHAGHGQSDGAVCTFGAKEQDDVHNFVAALRREFSVGKIAVSGRSMGGATGLLAARGCQPGLASVVVDSSFASLRELLTEKIGSWMLNFMAPAFQDRAGFSIDEANPRSAACRTVTPTLFITGQEDTLVQPDHTTRLHDSHLGPKAVFTFPGGHSGPRPQEVVQMVALFLESSLYPEPESVSITDEEQRDLATKVQCSASGPTVFEWTANGQKIIAVGHRCRIQRRVAGSSSRTDNVIKVVWKNKRFHIIDEVEEHIGNGAVRLGNGNSIAKRRRKA